MRYWISLIIVMLFSSCNERNISTLKHEKVKFKDLPIEIVKCIKNPNDFQEERNNMLIELPKSKNVDYTVENVKTWIGPWVSYVKLIDIKNNTSYKIDRGVPDPYIIFEDKLYVPDRYNIFTVVDDLNSLEFTRYELK
ncbi:hypothetical protein LV84_04287 [Algoriphagus ratkowskyi]|uniref:Lipoprotein n=1 Tax=Algoriphagus ratkowskyi TaxID=57028 RepID=A0A2W7QLA8_9BACT|nr:hypothetical protein [Algoriphagus ratkowskyi]PZX49223.1 hypothetical protein LV84_04287 [Algoriphagus ratkowskyi]TXD75365.1 hypothetical protein ESW18_20830 [Algoriphagus ratkowskyi]